MDFCLLSLGIMCYAAVAVVCAVLCCAVPRYETNLLNTAGQAMDFLSDVNHENTFVHLVRLAVCGKALKGGRPEHFLSP
jgi:hypothetical protein